MWSIETKLLLHEHCWTTAYGSSVYALDKQHMDKNYYYIIYINIQKNFYKLHLYRITKIL